VCVVSVSFAQMVVVSYMRLEGSGADYVEVEKKWEKMHEVRIAEGYMNGWQLMQVMFTGQESDFHYITTNHYANMEQYEKEYPGGFEALFSKTFPGEKWDNLSTATGASRVLTHNEVFWMEDQATSEKQAKYITVNYYKVKEGEGEKYVDMENMLTWRKRFTNRYMLSQSN